MRRLGIATAWALSLACADPSQLGTEGRLCAELVAFYLDTDSPVELTGGERNPGMGRVRIDFRTPASASAPSRQGVALCRFRSGPDGRLALKDAFVDDERLREDEIRAFEDARQP